MKSKRAYVMLSDTAFPVSEEESNDEYIDAYDVVTFNNAQTAVELAEEDMAEKAAKAFCALHCPQGCPMCGLECLGLITFKQKLME